MHTGHSHVSSCADLFAKSTTSACIVALLSVRTGGAENPNGIVAESGFVLNPSLNFVNNDGDWFSPNLNEEVEVLVGGGVEAPALNPNTKVGVGTLEGSVLFPGSDGFAAGPGFGFAV
jgi:hypothetical protein